MQDFTSSGAALGRWSSQQRDPGRRPRRSEPEKAPTMAAPIGEELWWTALSAEVRSVAAAMRSGDLELC
jgi:hypothetical protein